MNLFEGIRNMKTGAKNKRIEKKHGDKCNVAEMMR
jgi:hypothetical protein